MLPKRVAQQAALGPLEATRQGSTGTFCGRSRSAPPPLPSGGPPPMAHGPPAGSPAVTHALYMFGQPCRHSMTCSGMLGACYLGDLAIHVLPIGMMLGNNIQPNRVRAYTKSKVV